MKHFLLVILFFVTVFKASPQCFKKPYFNGVNIDTITFLNLNDYISYSFTNSYFKYFNETACGHYYDIVSFEIDSNGTVCDLAFAGPFSYMTEFIKSVLITTNGKWELRGCDSDNSQSQKIFIPIFFFFSDRCENSKMTMTYFAKPVESFHKPHTIGGLTFQSNTNSSITLWPIKCRGPILEKRLIDQNDNNRPLNIK